MLSPGNRAQQCRIKKKKLIIRLKDASNHEVLFRGVFLGQPYWEMITPMGWGGEITLKLECRFRATAESKLKTSEESLMQLLRCEWDFIWKQFLIVERLLDRLIDWCDDAGQLFSNSRLESSPQQKHPEKRQGEEESVGKWGQTHL